MSADALPAEVRAFLVAKGLLGERAELEAERLSGGVSSDLWKVRTPDRTLCVKGALARLRTTREWFAPLSRNQVECDYLRFAAHACPGRVPEVVAHDPAAGLIAMEYLPPENHAVWKGELLRGHVDLTAAAAVGDLVGRLHAASRGDARLRARFATDANFDSLRIEPFFRSTAARCPDLSARLLELGGRTSQIHEVVVHGDVSPKNILLGPHGPVLLDAECAWFGDPAFDVAFCVHHLLVKAVKMPQLASTLLEAATTLFSAYAVHVGWESVQHCEERVATLVPALALARVDGTSTVDYLDQVQREAVREAARRLLVEPASTLAAALDDWRLSTTMT